VEINSLKNYIKNVVVNIAAHESVYNQQKENVLTEVL